MTRFVLDSSYALSWVFPDERNAQRLATLASLADLVTRAITLPLWYSEITNALVVSERRGRITVRDTEAFLEMIEALPIAVFGDSLLTLAAEAAALARRHLLTVYDASYLWLAMEEALPLATLDEPLKKAAKKCGVLIIES
jgi:predicted nucleic acid-binding protein